MHILVPVIMDVILSSLAGKSLFFFNHENNTARKSTAIRQFETEGVATNECSKWVIEKGEFQVKISINALQK